MSEIIEMPYGTGKVIGFWRIICLASYPPQYRYVCSCCGNLSTEPSNSCKNCKTEMTLESEFFEKYSEAQLDKESEENEKDTDTV